MAAPTLQDMAAQDAASLKEHSDAQTAEQAKQTFGSTGRPNGILSWMTQMPKRITSDMIDSAVRAADSMAHDGSWGEAAVRAGRDVATGVADAAASTGKAVADFSEALDTGRAEKDYAETGGKGMSQIEQQRALEAQDPAMAARDRAMGDDAETLDYGQNPIWNHARSAIMDFRDAVAVKDPNLVDGLTQSVAQLAIPFAGYSKALSGVHDAAIAAQGLEDISATQGFGSYLMKTAQKDLTGLATKVVAPGAVTDATALQPHSMRFADLIALGRHTEGKLGDVLNALAPDGSAMDSYIRYLTDRGDESEAEGRWKNVLDGFGVNLLATPLIAAAGSVLKQGTAGLRYMIDNGVASSGDIVGIRPTMQRGAVGDLSTKPAAPAQDRMTRMMQMLHEQQHTKGAGVQYSTNGDLHTATSDNGVTTAIRQGNNLRVIDTETFEGGRGHGEGAARIERLLQEAQAKGLTLTSDSQVSAPAQKVYERLRSQGYDIKENPSRLDPSTGEKFSTSELKGVYEVRPKRLSRGLLPVGAAAAGVASAADAPAPKQQYANISDAQWAAEAPKYQTQLPPSKEADYQAWKVKMEKEVGHDLSSDDYDMRGAYLAGLKPSGSNLHFDDRFKKPNHMTFSTDSEYSGHPYTGGTWTQTGKRWAFRASHDNLRFHSVAQLTKYFKEEEPDSTLYVPGKEEPVYQPKAEK